MQDRAKIYKQEDLKMAYKSNYFNPEYKKYISSSEWKEKAHNRLTRDNFKCCVCGNEATEVHHLTYDNFKNEKETDLVSLCRKCHNKAEDIYDPAITPWAMDIVKENGNNFMAAMRSDAIALAPKIYQYLKESCGLSIESLMAFRQPTDFEGKRYWERLKTVVNALCRKRYYRNCAEDRTDIMLNAITNRVAVICLSEIEHYIRNAIQKDLQKLVKTKHTELKTWNAVSEALGIKESILKRLNKDDGTSFGPSLREAVIYYCGLDAAAGIKPLSDFGCLSKEDYTMLNNLADYMSEVSGNGAFKGEYEQEEQCI